MGSPVQLWNDAWAGSQDAWAGARDRRPTLDRVARAYWRAQHRHESELASTLTVRALLALVPATAAALALIGLALDNDADRTRVAHVLLDAFLPGLADPVLPDKALALGNGSAAVLAIWALLGLGLGWVRALRRGICHVSDAPLGPKNVFVEKQRDLITLLGLIAIISGCAVVSIVGRWTIHQAMDGWAADGVGPTMDVGTQALGVVGIWAALAFVGARVLSPPLRTRRGIVELATAGVLGISILKGFFVIWTHASGARNGSMYGTFAAVAGLLIWLSLVSRAVLLAASWAATPVDRPDPL